MKAFHRILAVGAMTTVAFLGEAETWSLDSCVAYAIGNNIDIRQRELNVKNGELDLTETKDRFLPSVDGSLSQSFNFGRGLTSENTYANRNTSSTQWSVGLNLPLFQGLAEYRRMDVAKLSIRQYLLDVDAAKDNVALNVISQYLQVLYCKEVARSARSQAELSQFEVERQKVMIEAGRVAEATLYDLESVAAQDRLQVVTADNDIRTALVNLANLLHLKSIEGFDISPLSDAEPPLPSPEQVYSSALGTDNTLLSARQGVRVAEGNISLAKTGYIPTLSFNAGIGSSYYTVAGWDSESFGSQMRNNFATYLGFSLRVPIFDGFNTRNSIRRAKLQKLTAELQVEDRESNLWKDIRLAYYQAVGARERYLTSGETLEKAQLSFEATQERFNLGRATQADYEQAKNNLFKTEIARIQAHYEYLIRLRILLFYSNPSASRK
ncbi:MAG: TolC family protein [Muribaculaceae bacterium]|nr:TolC family protein [Muribaculaceae bacterium]